MSENSIPGPQSYVTTQDFEASLIRQEHRLLPILRNFWCHGYRNNDRNDPRRTAAAEAFIWRIFSPATAAVAGASLIAMAGVVLAWQANRLLADQNNKLDQQNKKVEEQTQLISAQTNLIKVQNNLSDAQRRAGFAIELTSIMEEVTRLEQNSLPKTSINHGNKSKLQIPRVLAARVIAFSNICRPYRFLSSDGELNPKPLSPERGQLFMTLCSSQINWDLIQYCNFSHADLEGVVIRPHENANAFVKPEDLAHTLGPIQQRPAPPATILIYRLVDERNYRVQFADFSHALVKNAKVVDVMFDKCRFLETDMSDSRFLRCGFSSHLYGVNFRASKFIGTDFRQGYFFAVDFRDAKFEKCHHLADEDIEWAGSNINGAIFDDPTIKTKLLAKGAIDIPGDRWMESQSFANAVQNNQKLKDFVSKEHNEPECATMELMELGEF